MDNKCEKCGKTISEDSRKCDACKRTESNKIKKILIIIGGVAIPVIAAAAKLIKKSR